MFVYIAYSHMPYKEVTESCHTLIIRVCAGCPASFCGSSCLLDCRKQKIRHEQHMYIHAYICMYCIYIYKCLCTYIYMYVIMDHIYVYICVCVYIHYLAGRRHLYTRKCTRAHTCTTTQTHTTHTHTHTHTRMNHRS